MLKSLPDNVFDDNFIPEKMDEQPLAAHLKKKKEFNDIQAKVSSLFDCVNSMSDTRILCYAIVRALSKQHRTLQQAFVKEFLVAFCLYSEFIFKNKWFDARNEDVANLHKELKDIPEKFRFI